jgi:hypothetical protein
MVSKIISLSCLPDSCVTFANILPSNVQKELILFAFLTIFNSLTIDWRCLVKSSVTNMRSALDFKFVFSWYMLFFYFPVSESTDNLPLPLVNVANYMRPIDVIHWEICHFHLAFNYVYYDIIGSLFVYVSHWDIVETEWCSSYLKNIITSAVAEAVSNAVKPLIDMIQSQGETITCLQQDNTTLRQDNANLRRDVIHLSEQIELLEQYGRRTSLRFHNVPMRDIDKQRTDNIIVDIVKSKQWFHCIWHSFCYSRCNDIL